MRRKFVVACVATAVLTLSACGGSGDTSSADTPVGEKTSVSPKVLAACAKLFAGERDDPPAGGNVIVVADRTGSVADAPLPDGLSTDISEASRRDGTLTVIAVEGEGRPARLVAKKVPLSPEGDRDRPSVADFAGAMPSCVEETYLGATLKPSAPTTDLHAALAMAAEIADKKSIVWVISDMVPTSGPYALTADLLALNGTDAGSAAGGRAPINLNGATIKVSGVANTSTALLSAQRTWIRDFAQSLCGTWQAQGCDSIVLDPVNPERAERGLPADPVPFPGVAVIEAGTSCTFEVPASLTFAGDSSVLAEAAAEALQDPVQLLAANPSAHVNVVGHTASSSSRTQEELLNLSAARAEAVADHLRQQGIDGSRISTEGVGDSQPKGEDIDPATGRQIPEQASIERRVDLTVTGVGSCFQ